jgi:hypothetical protein
MVLAVSKRFDRAIRSKPVRLAVASAVHAIAVVAAGVWTWNLVSAVVASEADVAFAVIRANTSAVVAAGRRAGTDWVLARWA